jgi:hypothetical protein
VNFSRRRSAPNVSTAAGRELTAAASRRDQERSAFRHRSPRSCRTAIGPCGDVGVAPNPVIQPRSEMPHERTFPFACFPSGMGVGSGRSGFRTAFSNSGPTPDLRGWEGQLSSNPSLCGREIGAVCPLLPSESRISHPTFATALREGAQMAEVAAPRQMFVDILSLIARLRAPRAPA